MKRIIAIALFLIFTTLIPAQVSAGNYIFICCLSSDVLQKAGLSNEELSEIRGQGFEVPVVKDTKIEEARIILWDEAAKGTVKINLSTGYGNSQRSTLSVIGR
jgi:hypothetical protein